MGEVLRVHLFLGGELPQFTAAKSRVTGEERERCYPSLFSALHFQHTRVNPSSDSRLSQNLPFW